MRKVQFIVRGLVQGVGFRYFAVRKAEALGLCGWVENLEDGSVQTVAEGPDDDVASYIKDLRQGPRFAQVEDLEMILDTTITTFSERGFHVRR